MPLDQVQTAVQDFLGDHWATTDIAYENDGFVPGVGDDGAIVPWVLVEVFGGLFQQWSIGAGGRPTDNLWQDSGMVWLHVVVPSGSGPLQAKQYASGLAELFRGLELEPGIVFGDIEISPGGSENGNDWTLSVGVQWQQWTNDEAPVDGELLTGNDDEPLTGADGAILIT